jgi:iron-regulated transporter 1
VTTLALIFFSASVGKWVDLSPCRLHTLLVTIFVNRLCVILACLCWFLIVDVAVPGEQPRSGLAHGIRPRLPLPALAAWWPQARSTIPLHATAKESFFILALLVGVPEKLSGVANMLSMERDWVPTLSSAVADTMPTYDLTHLNAVMRRIDLTCKLIAPIVISFVVSVTGSTRTGVLFSIAMSLVSCPVEWWCARQAWDRIPQLQNQNPIDLHHPASDMPASHNRLQRQFYSVSIAARSWLQDQWGSWQEYFHASVWIPSFALSILHLSVLSYSATFITYLLSTGEFSLTTITIARAISSLIEVSSTLVMPWGVRYLSRRQRQGWQLLPAEEEESGFAQDAHTSETSVGLQRLGLWGLWGQFLSLVSPISVFASDIVTDAIFYRSPWS